MSETFMFRTTIQGRPISKKNSKRILRNPKTNKPFVLPSEAFIAFRDDALKQLTQYHNIKLAPPYRIDYLFKMKGKIDADADNLQAGINDILQEAGIIVDDKFIIEGSFRKVFGNEEFSTELLIEKL